jgi:hypothetical protein
MALAWLPHRLAPQCNSRRWTESHTRGLRGFWSSSTQREEQYEAWPLRRNGRSDRGRQDA